MNQQCPGNNPAWVTTAGAITASYSPVLLLFLPLKSVNKLQSNVFVSVEPQIQSSNILHMKPMYEM